MAFEPLRRLKAPELIAARIRDAILGGRYRPGDTLPSERSLAEQFAVNRSTLREALKRLDAQGLLETRHGGKTRVRDFLESAGLSLLPHLIAPGGEVDLALLRDLLELRVELLAWTAGLAAQRREPEGVTRLEELLGELAAAEAARERQELDWAFFAALVELSGNRVLGFLVRPMRAVYDHNLALFEHLYHEFPLDDHRAAVIAIALGDGDAAASALRRYGQRALGGEA